MSGPFMMGKPVVVSGHITDIHFARYDREYCYFTLHCEDDVGIKATIPCRIIGKEDVDIFKNQGINPGDYLFINGSMCLLDHDNGRSYWVDVNWVHSEKIKKQFVKPVVDTRIAKNQTWFKALSTKISDNLRGVQDNAYDR